MIQSLNPATGELLRSFEALTSEALEAKLFSRDMVLNLLARRREPAAPAPLSAIALPLAMEPVADCARYDSLRSMGEFGGAC